MKKTLIMVLVVAMVIAIMPTMALAATTINVSDSAGLNAALNSAGDGDTIAVADGTYVLDATVITKDISIIGDSEAGVVFTPSASATYWVNVQAEASLKIKNVTMDGAGFNILRALYANGGLTVENVTITNIKSATYVGMGISFYQDANDPTASLYVKNVTMSNIERIGIHAKGDTTVIGFDYTGKGAIDCLDYAMEIGTFSQWMEPFTVNVTDITVRDCLGVASTDGSTSAGIYINTYFYSSGSGSSSLITVNIKYANIINCSYGAAFGYLDTLGEYSNTLILDSNFIDCPVDVQYDGANGTGTVESAGNYFGGGAPVIDFSDPNAAIGFDVYRTAPANATEVKAGVDPTFMINIPAAVDFGTLIKGSGEQTQDFVVEAQGTVLEPGASIVVTANGPFVMKDNDGAGEAQINFQLWNSANQVGFDDEFAAFFGDRTEDGTVRVNTNEIETAGSYKGTMSFTIEYIAN